MIDPRVWAQPRSDATWTYELLDRDEFPLGELNVLGGSLELKALARLGGSAEMTLDSAAGDIDWLSHRVRVTYDPGIAGVEPWAMATLLFTSPSEDHYDGGGLGHDVTLLTKLAVIDEDAFDDPFAYAEGTRIIDAVAEIIESTGERAIALTPSDATLRSQLVVEAAESKLTVVNKLLEAAGYWSLFVDGEGQYRVEPYLEIKDRPVAFRFGPNSELAASIMAPEWSRSQDMSRVPNKFVVVGQGSDEEPPLVGVALNLDPDSPFSIPRRGRVIAERDEGVELADQGVANLLAQRRLTDLMRPVENIEASHAIVPILPNEVIEFEDEAGVVRKATVQSLEYEFEFDAQAEAKWRGVA